MLRRQSGGGIECLCPLSPRPWERVWRSHTAQKCGLFLDIDEICSPILSSQMTALWNKLLTGPCTMWPSPPEEVGRWERARRLRWQRRISNALTLVPTTILCTYSALLSPLMPQTAQDQDRYPQIPDAASEACTVRGIVQIAALPRPGNTSWELQAAGVLSCREMTGASSLGCD